MSERVGDDVAVVAEALERGGFWDALDAFSSVQARLEAAEAEIEMLSNCDCVYAPVSSRSCHKCGRRAVVTHEAWLEIVKAANERDAARADAERLAGAGRAMLESGCLVTEEGALDHGIENDEEPYHDAGLCATCDALRLQAALAAHEEQSA